MTCGRAGENTATMKIFMGITGSNIGGVFLTFSTVTFSISSLWARLLRFLSAWRGGSGAKVTDCWSCCTTTTSCEWPQGADFSFSFFFLWKDTNTSVLNVKDLCECVWTVVWMHWPISCDVTFDPMTQFIRAARGLQDLISSSQTNRGTAAGSDGRRTDLSLSVSRLFVHSLVRAEGRGPLLARRQQEDKGLQWWSWSSSTSSVTKTSQSLSTHWWSQNTQADNRQEAALTSWTFSPLPIHLLNISHFKATSNLF